MTSSSASILGKNYLKQVDVIMTDWMTGPELLISTKRMDSSYGKNAANRVEESYGDAKNLRLRHPLAALGFVFGLRSDILQKEPDTAEWLIDLLEKLGREDDAYHATCLVMIEHDDAVAAEADGGEDPENLAGRRGNRGGSGRRQRAAGCHGHSDSDGDGPGSRGSAAGADPSRRDAGAAGAGPIPRRDGRPGPRGDAGHPAPRRVAGAGPQLPDPADLPDRSAPRRCQGHLDIRRTA